MVEARYGGEDGEAVQLEVDPDLVAVRTYSRRSLREGPVQHPEAALLSEMEPVLSFPEAGVEVYRRQEGSPRSPDELRQGLRESPDTRFAGRVLVDEHSGEPVLYTENLFVKFQDDKDREHCLEVLRQRNLDVKQELPYATNAFFVAAPEGTGQEVFDIANELLQREDVEYAHPELVRRLGKRTIFPQQWHLKTTVIGDRSISASANVEAAHALSRGVNVTVAIIDTGIDIDHGEFSSPGKIVAPRDTTSNDANPRPDFDGEKHGTACAGVACADGRFGASGVAPRARLMPIRMQSQLGSLAEANAFYWAARNGADIISCSWGPADGHWWDPDDPNHSARVPLPDSTRLAIDYATTKGRNGKGCVVLFAAGNGNESVDNDGYANYKNVLAVAACNDQSRRSVYSDFGNAVFCAFPSNDFSAQGRPAPLTPGIFTTDRTGRGGYNRFGNFTNSFGGTSSACPGAAGVAALVLSRNPSLRRDEVKDILRRSCDRIDSQGGQYDTNGHSASYGYGRLNAEKAVRSAVPPSGSVRRKELDESGKETSMGETLGRDEVRDGALDRTDVEHVELENFTSSIVGVAGYYPLGSFAFPTGGFHQSIVGTKDGKLTELFWRPGEPVNQEELLDFSKILVPAGISAVAAYYSDNDGFHHQDVATEDGTLHEIFWRPGPGVNRGVLRKFDSPIAGVGAYFVAEDGFHHQDVATEDGTLHELFWRPGPGVNHGVLENFTSPIVGVAAFDTPDGFQHQIVATQDHNLHQLWFRPGPAPPDHRVLQEFTSDILGVAGYNTPDGFRRAIVATGDGNLTRLSWKPGEDIDLTEIPHGLATRVVAVAGYFSYGDNRQHLILATEDGTVHDLNFGIEDDLGYPGDTASKPEIARWMARCAEERDLPPELPVMTSLVEVGAGSGFGWNEGMRNVRDAIGFSSAVDFDSLGFFQQRQLFWGCRREGNRCTVQQRLENIIYPPHAITEFLDEAENVKFRDGFSNEDERFFGAWAQAVQISGFPFRYQEQLIPARILINS